MTAQVSDNITIDGKRHLLHCEPMDQYEGLPKFK